METKNPKSTVNFGLIIKDDDPNAYVLGAGMLPKIVYQPNGSWKNYLPIYEPQFGEGWDTYGCTVWGTQNCIETLLKRLEGVEYNFSERFNYILAGITPPGADPHRVIESIREYGLIDQKFLPMTKTYKEFVTPKPMTDDLEEEGLKFKYKVRHEYLWVGAQSKESRTTKIRQALRYSPLGVSVTAWINEGGVYVDNGQPNSHWCMLFDEDALGWKVFDSYDQSIKIISFDHNIQIAKRFYLEPSNELQQVSLLKKIIKILKGWLGENKPLASVEKIPVVEEKLDSLIEALCQVESGGYVDAMGDLSIPVSHGGPAYGILQIRGGVLSDVNELWGTSYKGKDLLGTFGAKLSKNMCKAYFLKVCPQYRAYKKAIKSGMPLMEVNAKCWNGGVGFFEIQDKSGYEKYKKALDGYWRKVQKNMV